MSKRFVPEFVDQSKLHKHNTKDSSKGLQLVDRSNHRSRISYDRSYLGSIHKIWKRLPNDLVKEGSKQGWLKIKKSCTMSITQGMKIKKGCTISITKGLKIKKGNKKAIETPVQDGFTIGGF